MELSTLFKAFSSVIPFIEEILFDKTIIKNFTDPLFDIKRTIYTLIFIISIFLNILLFYRLIIVSHHYVVLSHAYDNCDSQLKKMEKEP